MSSVVLNDNIENYVSDSFGVFSNNDNLKDEESILKSDHNNISLEKTSLDSFNDLKNIRKKNSDRLIIAQININSLRNKFEFLVEIIKNNVDILLVSETKIDSSFPNTQFYIIGYTTYRLDRNLNGGGLLLYVKDDIPSSMLNMNLSIEGFFIEINVRKKKWLVGCSYNPKTSSILTHLENLGRCLNKTLSTYDNFILLGDMNAEPSNQILKDFCQLYSCKNLINDKTCFKNLQNPSCIDLMITNRPKSFQSSVVLETGLSDFHKMTLTVMKVFYKKIKPNLVKYRNYKYFDNTNFMNDIENEISHVSHENEIIKFDLFKNTVFRTFEKHAPLKKRYVRANQAPFINKNINKEIMTRSRLRNKFLKSKREVDRINFNRQRNLCVSLIRKEKKKYFSNINTRDITDNKNFWKTVKPFFTDKIQTKSKITLIEDNIIHQENGDDLISEEIISDDKTVSEIFNNYFINIVPNLNIPTFFDVDSNFVETIDPISNSIEKFSNHPSIIRIKEKNQFQKGFSFSKITYDDILNKIKNLDTAKTSQQTDIPTKVLKCNSEYFAKYFYSNINFCIENSEFPSDLKVADVIPVYKKKSKNSKDNYRPVSILSNISKIYEKAIYEQLQSYFKDILSKHQCGFRKGYNAQTCLIVLIEKWKQIVDNGGAFGALLTDLSKAFDCLSHELLIAKLAAYGFDENSLKLMHSYLTNRMQRVKINDCFSSWDKILYGVPQGSILGPLLFNIFICDMFYFLEEHDIANYADDSTPFCAKENHELVVKDLEKSSSILFWWLKINHMKINTDKSHLLMSGDSIIESNIDNNHIESEYQQELLGILIDSNLTFQGHINNLCKKAGQKLNALARISSFMNMEKRRVIMKSFIVSQFGYCPLIWMFHSRSLNNKINFLHERALRITYDDKNLTFEELLKKDKSVSIHHRNLQILAIEMFKVYNHDAPSILNDIFIRRTPVYNLRDDRYFESRKVRSVYHGTESLSFLGPKIWDLVPCELKRAESLDIFKAKIKQFTFSECPCRLCKTFVPNLGFI